MKTVDVTIRFENISSLVELDKTLTNTLMSGELSKYTNLIVAIELVLENSDD